MRTQTKRHVRGSSSLKEKTRPKVDRRNEVQGNWVFALGREQTNIKTPTHMPLVVGIRQKK